MSRSKDQKRLAIPSNREFWLAADVIFYKRRSDPGKAGNLSLQMQEEDVPKRLQATAGCTLAEIEAAGGTVSVFEDEDISGTDADTRVDLDDSAEITIRGFKRGAYQGMLKQARDRWRATGRPQVIAGFMLNRVGRSLDSVYLLRNVAREMRGNLHIWVTDQAGMFVDPTSDHGRMQLFMSIDYAANAESKVKRQFVSGIKDHIAETDPDRSLSERLAGYRRYPCDQFGQRLEDLSVVPDHYRLEVDAATRLIPERAFALAQSGVRPRQIAQALQREFGPHPISGRRWTRTAVSWMLRNTLYIGYRTYKRRTTDDAGSSHRYAVPTEEQMRSPYKETLRIVPDEVFFAVQRRLTEWAGRREMGRPLQAEAYFHRTEVLRCGICERALTITKQGEKHWYRCDGLTNRGYPRCQSHEVSALDGHLTTVVASMFSSVDDYRRRLQRDLSASRNGDRLAMLQAQLKRLQDELTEKKARMLRAASDDTLGKHARKAINDDFEAAAEAVEQKEQEIQRFGQSAGDKAKAELLSVLNAVAAFQVAPFAERKAIFLKLFDGIFVWPDGAHYLQMKGESLDATRQKILELTGRVLGEGRGWGAVDFVRLEADTRRLIEEGEIPQEAFADLVSSATTYQWFVKKRTITPTTVVRLYRRALTEWVNLPALRTALEGWIDAAVASGMSWYAIEKDAAVAKGTLQKLHRRGPVRRDSLVKLAPMVGGLEAFSVLPDWLYQPPSLDDVAAMLDQREQLKAPGNPSLASDESGDTGTLMSSYQRPEWIMAHSSQIWRTLTSSYGELISPS